MRNSRSMLVFVSIAASAAGFLGGFGGVAFWFGSLSAAVTENKRDIEAHATGDPHRGVPAALAVLNEQVMALTRMIKDSTDDRFRGRDALAARARFCKEAMKLNPGWECPEISE